VLLKRKGRGRGEEKRREEGRRRGEEIIIRLLAL
jgi:hypothetical protein